MEMSQWKAVSNAHFSSISLRDDMGPVAADPMGELLVWGLDGASKKPGFPRLSLLTVPDTNGPSPLDGMSWGCYMRCRWGLTDWCLWKTCSVSGFFWQTTNRCGCVVVGDSAPIHRWPSFSASTVVGSRGSTVGFKSLTLLLRNVGNGGNEWDDDCPMKNPFPTFSTSKLLCRILNHPASNWRRNIAAIAHLLHLSQWCRLLMDLWSWRIPKALWEAMYLGWLGCDVVSAFCGTCGNLHIIRDPLRCATCTCLRSFWTTAVLGSFETWHHQLNHLIFRDMQPWPHVSSFHLFLARHRSCEASYHLAESQKPPGLLSIGADEGVRIHILSGRACKTSVKLIWNIDFYAGGTYVMRMWSVCAAQVKTYVSRMWNICETYAKYMWHINVFWDWIALCLCFTYVYVCEFMCFFMPEEK